MAGCENVFIRAPVNASPSETREICRDTANRNDTETAGNFILRRSQQTKIVCFWLHPTTRKSGAKRNKRHQISENNNSNRFQETPHLRYYEANTQVWRDTQMNAIRPVVSGKRVAADLRQLGSWGPVCIFRDAVQYLLKRLPAASCRPSNS